ncbi:methionine--tRNA ligase [Metamycoplasma salivarium]|uniref:methionine--tRNA ligase n=1 Tax=Metamycoplasma salivarium TaxID=2124 RepID=UPI001EEDD3C2|nr:methionine--tRNA ligase [Metamycoplasma salivarium]GIZ06122.1 methionine--tRNA ligase [Metamycoplasma salivarium]
MKAKKTFYITTPIYYPSGNLHIGHVLTTTLAWAYRNYKKMLGYDTFFSTGIDEHGQKIQKKALSLNLEPKKYVDNEAQKFIDLWNLLQIDYDYFSRTTNEEHEKIVNLVFNKMLEKGYIYKGYYEGLYSVDDEEFLTISQALKKDDGNFYHPISGHLLKEIKEESYFFKMSKLEKWIKEFFLSNPNFLSNKSTTKELLNNFINKGLEDLSITRVSFDWGIKISKTNIKEPQHVIYVWLDALFSYLSTLNYSEEDDSLYEKYWANGDERIHVLGKEIARFHAIYWPIFLKSLDLNLPTKEIIHSWIITPEGKMSKSKGNVIEPIPLIKKYGAEEIKYFFATQINIDNDFSYSEEMLINVLNADLSNNFGNLLNRVAKMVNQSFPNGTKFDQKNILEIDKKIFEKIETLKKNFDFEMSNYYIDKAFKYVVEFSSNLNEYIDKTEPWKLKNDLTRLNVVLNTLLLGIYQIASYFSIILPNKMSKAFAFLNVKNNQKFSFDMFDNKKITVTEILFPRITK